VIVISAHRPNVDATWKTALVIPTSSSTRLWTPYCVKLSAGTGGLDRKTWARVPAVQPFMKSALGNQVGVLPDRKLEEIHARLLDYMGLLTQADPE
jgi:mRNA-degrading endonuclease toxin of MazEF toxin-antitoxin module